MKNTFTFLFLIGLCLSLSSACKGQSDTIRLKNTEEGWILSVNAEPMFIKGINWGHQPIGTTYTYSLWEQEPDSIKNVLDRQMSMLRDAGINAIRVYTGIQKEWIQYIYEEYGIYTMLNHSFGRYGIEINGQWNPHTDYANPAVRAKLLQEVNKLAERFKGTPGLLLYLLGNENNYGLFWEGAETEDIPEEDSSTAVQARAMYNLFNEAADRMNRMDGNVPVAVCNGDLQFIDIMAEEMPSIDILGVNVYRGLSFTDLFAHAKAAFGKPVLLTEFGSDAFNMSAMQEDQLAQARYVKENWQEIYLNAAGMNGAGAGNALGGFTFQFVDGWWKHDQSLNLNVHDSTASWANGGYTFDYIEGQNNMNEEWFGVVSWDYDAQQGTYYLKPRAAYFILMQAHAFDPYAQSSNPGQLKAFFKDLSIDEAAEKAKSYPHPSNKPN